MPINNLTSVYLFPPGFAARRFLECKEKLFPYIVNMSGCHEYDSAIAAIRKHKPDIVFIALYHDVEDISVLRHETDKAGTTICFIVPTGDETKHKAKYNDSIYLMTDYKENFVVPTIHRLRNEVIIKRHSGGLLQGTHALWMLQEIKVRHDKEPTEKKLVYTALFFKSTRRGKCADVSFTGGLTDHHSQSINHIMDAYGKDNLFQTSESGIVVIAKIAISIVDKRILILEDHSEHHYAESSMKAFKAIVNGHWREM